MEIKRRVKALEEKWNPQKQPDTRYREYFSLVMGDPELRELVRQLADQQAEAYVKNPGLYERLRAGETVGDGELREAGIDPDLWRLCAVKIEEIRNRREAEGRLQ